MQNNTRATEETANRKNQKSRLPNINILGVLATILTFAIAGGGVELYSQEDSSEDIDQDSSEDIVELDTYEVVGYGDSLRAARDMKRQADQILDAVVAEDIGRLPDTTLADALERIPGVQVSRGEFGEGGTVAVRGTVHNRFEINDRALIGTDANTRRPDLSDIPAELFESIEVFKSPTADMVEGSLGSTIRLRTRKPLSRGSASMLVANAQVSVNEAVSGISPKASVTAGYNWRDTANGDFGFLATLSYEESTVRSASFATGIWFDIERGAPGTSNGIFNRNYVYDLNGDGEVDPRDTSYPDRYFRPGRIAMNGREGSWDRIGWESTLQWQPNDEWEFRLETSLSANDGIGQGTQLSFNTGGGSVPDLTVEPVFSDDRTLLVGSQQNVDVLAQPQPSRNVSDRESYTAAFISKYELDQLSAEFMAASGRGAREDMQNNFRSRYAGPPTGPRGRRNPRTTIGFDFRDEGIPDLSYSQDFVANLSDPDNYVINQWSFFTTENNTYGDVLQLDFDYDTDLGWLRSFEFGARYSKRSADRRREILSGSPRGQLAPELTTPLLRPTPFHNIIGSIPGSDQFPTNYLTTVGTTFEDFVTAFEQANGVSLYDFDMEDDINYPFDISEVTLGGYGKLNFYGWMLSFPYSGNIGVRVVETDTESSGFLQSVQAGVRKAEPREENRSYRKTLPSGNLSLSLKDDVILRMAIAGVMARPRLEQISVTTGLNPGDLSDEGFPRGGGGNPDLEPFSSTQYDLSLEWHVGRRGLLSVAGFYKDIEASIITRSRIESHDIGSGPMDFVVRRPFNGPATTVKGIELSAQQTLRFLPSPFDGFGINVNYTYTDDAEDSIDIDGDPVPLEGLSENTYGITVYWEKRGLGFRASHKFRSEYVSATISSNGLPDLRMDVHQTDIAAHYRLNDRVRLTLNAVNITDEFQQGFNKLPERITFLNKVGRQVLAGATIRF